MKSAMAQAEGDRGPDSGGREGMTKLAMARSGASIGAPGAMLNATCSFAVRQRSVAMDPWILDPQTAGETHKFLESTPLSFLRAGPPKFRRISAESRAHPNFDKKFAKLRHRPTCGKC